MLTSIETMRFNVMLLGLMFATFAVHGTEANLTEAGGGFSNYAGGPFVAAGDFPRQAGSAGDW